MDYKQYNDYELIYMIRENDDDSRDILYQKYLPVLKKIASKYFYQFKDYGYEFEDFLQEARIAFEKAITIFDESKSSLFYSFVLLCVTRSLMSFCRNISNSSKNISSNNIVDIMECNISDYKNSFEFVEDDIFVKELYKKILVELPFDLSVIFELRTNGFSYREISYLLDIPSSTVEFRSRRIKSYLKKILKKTECY